MSHTPFSSSAATDPPTQRQIQYARTLGIEVTPGMSKREVSAAIDLAVRARPRPEKERQFALEEQRQREIAKRIAKFGEEVLALERQWEQYAETTEWMLAVYNRGKDNVVDVLRVNGASAREDGHIELDVTSPKLVRDRDDGDSMEWNQQFLLRLDDLLHHEPLPNFNGSKSDEYKSIVERGMTIAKKLGVGQSAPDNARRREM